MSDSVISLWLKIVLAVLPETCKETGCAVPSFVRGHLEPKEHL